MSSATVRVVLAVSLTSAVRLAAQSVSSESRVALIHTEATVTRYVPADLATLTVQFSATGRTAREAGLNVAARADSLRHAFQAAGVSRDSLPTASGYWGRARVEQLIGTRFVAPPPGSVSGSIQMQDTTFRASDAIEVRIHDLRRIGAVIDSALAHRVTDISPIQLRATNTQSAQDSAFAEATRHARRKADIIATAGGARLGPVVALSTQPTYAESPFPGLSVRSAGSGEGTEVIQSQMPVTVTVYATWQLTTTP